MILDGRELGPLAIDVATTIEASDGLRWRVLVRPIGKRRHRGPPGARDGEHRPGPPGRDDREGGPPVRTPDLGVLAAWASLEPVESEIRSLAAALPVIALGLWALAAAVGRYFAPRHRPADTHGCVGPRDALRRRPPAHAGHPRRAGRFRPQLQRAARPPQRGGRAAKAIHRPGFAPASHPPRCPHRGDRSRPPPAAYRRRARASSGRPS